MPRVRVFPVGSESVLLFAFACQTAAATTGAAELSHLVGSRAITGQAETASSTSTGVLASSAQESVSRTSFSQDEMESLLLNGRIVVRKGTARKGITDAYRVTLSDGQTTHDAQVQNIDVYSPHYETGTTTEINFRDTYRYNIAAYRLARLLGLTNVPVSVLRTVDGRKASMTWWVDDVIMDESARMKLAPSLQKGPDPSRTAAYIHVLRVFDELIQNRDRNAGNILWTKDWTLWMIDHTRAFRTGRTLLRPKLLERCDRTLCDTLRQLTRASMTQGVGDTLLKDEVDGVLARRDLIMKVFDEMITQRGEAAILYSLPR